MTGLPRLQRVFANLRLPVDRAEQSLEAAAITINRDVAHDVGSDQPPVKHRNHGLELFEKHDALVPIRLHDVTRQDIFVD